MNHGLLVCNHHKKPQQNITPRPYTALKKSKLSLLHLHSTLTRGSEIRIANCADLNQHHNPMRSDKKSTISNKEIVFMYNIQKIPDRINLYLLFLAQYFNSFDIQNDHETNIIWQFDEFTKKLFFSIAISTDLMAAVETTWNSFRRYMERCSPINHCLDTDSLTALMLTKCVNTLTGNLPDFH